MNLQKYNYQELRLKRTFNKDISLEEMERYIENVKSELNIKTNIRLKELDEGYYGHCYKSGKTTILIEISNKINKLYKFIDTLAHEIAHMRSINHTEKHFEYTKENTLRIVKILGIN